MNSIRPSFPFFPATPTGETVYSVFSRCIERSGLPYTYITRELTSQRNITSLLSVLPGYLGKVAERIPAGHPWRDPVVIVRDHTGLAYFTYFDDEATRQGWLQRYIETDFSNSIPMALGLAKFACGAKPPHPRFCPTCVQEDTGRLGFSCFYREHQLPGVAVCWKHGTPLAQGCTHCGPYPIKGMALRMAGKCNCDRGISPLPAHASLPDHTEPLIWLARQSAYLVNSTGTRHEDIRRVLRDHALGRGLGRGSLIEPSKLSEAIERRFGTATLEWLKMPANTNGAPSPWVRRTLNPSNSGVKRSLTIHYLLIIGALFDSVEAFEQTTSSNRKPSALNDSPISPVSAGDMEVPAELLANKLLPLLHAGNCGLPGIAQRLGVTPYRLIPIIRKKGWRVPLSRQTVKKLGEDKVAAIRRDLRNGVEKIKIQRQHGCSEWAVTLIELDDPGLNEDFRKAMKQQTRDRNRSQLANYLATKPDATRTDVMTELSGVYDYLITNDKEWFYEQLPEKKRPAPTTRKKRVNSAGIDQIKANEAEKIFLVMLSTEAKPVRATKTAVLKKLGLFRKYTNAPSDFPLVTKVIDERTESRPDFVKRRLAWAIGEMARDGVPISVNKLRRVAALPAPELRLNKDFVITHTRQLNADVEATSFFG